MVTSTGGAAVRQFMAQAPQQIAEKVLRGAARAAANVIADEARERVESEDVRDALATKVNVQTSQIVSTIYVEPGFAHSIGVWLEWGTAPHLISVDESQRGGRSVNRINKQAKQPDSSHSLVIGGQFVGATVMHPGARPHPFLRVSLDVKATDAIAAAQSYINARVSPAGITGDGEPESEDA